MSFTFDRGRPTPSAETLAWAAQARRTLRQRLGARATEILGEPAPASIGGFDPSELRPTSLRTPQR
jgi:hypothetical protein